MTTEDSGAIGTTWVDIKTLLSLADGTQYTITNNGGRDIILREAASTPTSTAQGHPVPSKRSWIATPVSGINIYARTSQGFSSLAVTEA